MYLVGSKFAVDTFTLNYVIGLGDHTVPSDNLTEKVIFGSSGWEKQFPEKTCFMPSASRKPIPLKGLDSGKNYTVKEINLYPGVRSSIGAEKKIYSGHFLMTVGINPDANGRRTSVLLEINEIRK